MTRRAHSVQRTSACCRALLQSAAFLTPPHDAPPAPRTCVTPPTPNAAPCPAAGAARAVAVQPVAYYSAPPPASAYPSALPPEMMSASNPFFAKPPDWDSRADVKAPLTLALDNAVIGGVPAESTKAGGADFAGGADAPVPPHGPPGAYPSLLALLDATYDDHAMLQGLLAGPDAPAWRALLASLTPPAFGEVVGKVNLEFDQPKVALYLANSLPRPLPAAYVVCAVRAASKNVRASIASALLPLCDREDVRAQQGAIVGSLDEWERICVGAVRTLHKTMRGCGACSGL